MCPRQVFIDEKTQAFIDDAHIEPEADYERAFQLFMGALPSNIRLYSLQWKQKKVSSTCVIGSTAIREETLLVIIVM